MKKRVGLSSYDFLKLYVSVQILNGGEGFLINRELELLCNRFFDCPEYSVLFHQLFRSGGLEESQQCILLTPAFEMAYGYGLLTKVSKGDRIYSVINFSLEDAKKFLAQFEFFFVDAMTLLYRELKEMQTSDKTLSKQRK